MFSTNSTANSAHSLRLRILAATLLLALAACSQKTPAPVAAAPDTAPVAPSADSEREARAMYQQGLDAMAAKDYPRAMYQFSQFVERYPDKAGGYANLALIEFRNDHPQRAQELVDKSLELNPANAQAHNLRAQISLKNGEIKLALKHYQRAVELDPQYANAHYNLALLYDIYLRDIELALRHYQQYLAHSDEKDEKTRDWVAHLESMLKK
jgi:Tfp pilus assembly protein PilF